MKATALQPDTWSSRKEAEAAVKENPFFKTWDPRVLGKTIKLHYRETQNFIYSEAGRVTKRTTDHQEFVGAWRPNFDNVGMQGRPAISEEKRTYPDVDSSAPIQSPFYMSSVRQAFFLLHTVRLAVYFIYGEKSLVAYPAIRKARVESCGTGYGGNGGVQIGRVKETLLRSGYFFLFMIVSETATAVSDYLEIEIAGWKEAEATRLEEGKP